MPNCPQLLPSICCLLESYPHKVNVSLPNGILIYANAKFLEGSDPAMANSLIGTYNILEDPNLEAWGLKDHVERAFRAEYVKTEMVEFPSKLLPAPLYGKEHAFYKLYQDIISYPVKNDLGQWTHVVTCFEPSSKQIKRTELLLAKQYIDQNYGQQLNLQPIAKAASLSVSRLNTLFKEDLGFTIHEYLIEVRLRAITKELRNTNLSVATAFEKCGMAYNSHYTALFKAFTGKSPTQYRKDLGNL